MLSEQQKQEMIQAAAIIRRDIIEMTFRAGNQGAHAGGSLSLAEILAVLYLGVMKTNASNPEDEVRDRLILSKGHGAMALYSILCQRGFLTHDDVLSYKSENTLVTAHTSRHPERGLEFASGSLGQGLSLGVGVSLGLKLKKNTSSRVFVIHGDGELNEGSVWEAAVSASHYHLENLVAIVDRNRLQYDGATDDVMNMGDLEAKWQSFGWETVNVNGHDVEMLFDVLSRKQTKPLAVIAETVKGKGVSFMENDAKWHHGRLSRQQYELALSEQEAER